MITGGENLELSLISVEIFILKDCVISIRECYKRSVEGLEQDAFFHTYIRLKTDFGIRMGAVPPETISPEPARECLGRLLCNHREKKYRTIVFIAPMILS